MPDIGHERTDELLDQLERRLASVYRTASKEMQDKITEYFESFAKRDAEMRELIGQTVNGKEWTEQDYKQWRLNQIGRGERFETYVIPGERGSGVVCLNGAAARRVQPGDVVIIIAYALMDAEEAKTFKPVVVFPDTATNRLV